MNELSVIWQEHYGTLSFIAVTLFGLLRWKGPTRATTWRWLEFQAGVNAEACELRERRRQGRRERMEMEIRDAA